MACGTIRPKLTVVRVILPVAGETIRRGRSKVNQTARVQMTLRAGKIGMTASELERKNFVIKILIETIYTIMTVKTGSAK